MRIGSAHLWVHDQEIALKFWTEKVGMEVTHTWVNRAIALG